MKIPIALLILALTIPTGLLQAFVEVKIEFKNQKPGAPAVVQPTAGTMATTLSELVCNEAEGTSAKVENVEAFGHNALVITDDSPEKGCGIYFGGGAKENATYEGKLFGHIEWAPLNHKTGNVCFISLCNLKGEGIFSICIGNDQQTVTAFGGERIDAKGAIPKGEIAKFDWVVDIGKWTYALKLDGKEIATGTLAASEDRSFWRANVGTTGPAITNFAIDNIIISSSPIKEAVQTAP